MAIVEELIVTLEPTLMTAAVLLPKTPRMPALTPEGDRFAEALALEI
jgi:hypothetical protein